MRSGEPKPTPFTFTLSILVSAVFVAFDAGYVTQSQALVFSVTVTGALVALCPPLVQVTRQRYWVVWVKEMLWVPALVPKGFQEPPPSVLRSQA